MMNATDYEAAKDDASASVPAITPALTPAEENLIDVPAALPEEDSPAPPEPTAALHSSDDEAAETDPQPSQNQNQQLALASGILVLRRADARN